MASTPTIEQLRKRREALKAELTRVGDLRPGSLVERYRKCGKANCWCAQQGPRGHGPEHVRDVSHEELAKAIEELNE